MSATMAYTFIPMFAAIAGVLIAVTYVPSPQAISAFQHFAAGIVFAAAAGEVLPEVLKQANSLPILIGGMAGILMTFIMKEIDEQYSGSFSFILSVVFDTLIDGLIIGLGFVAGTSQGFLLTFALSVEVLFLGLALTSTLSPAYSNRTILFIGVLIGAMLPIGASLGFMAANLSQDTITAGYTFGLIALLYLVTEELLVEAHTNPQHDSPFVTSLFFVGFLGVVLFEHAIRH